MLYSLLGLKSLTAIVKRKVLLIAYNMLFNTHVERVAMNFIAGKTDFLCNLGLCAGQTEKP
jgi:hypothetical protein